MPRTAEQLRDDAMAIWRAGLEAVRSETLVQQAVSVDGHGLRVADTPEVPLEGIGRVVVMGAGKAGAGMAEGLLNSLQPLCSAGKEITGWVNVPADCVRPLTPLHLHPARPAGVNEPTPQAMEGAEKILQLCASAGPKDIGFCLISGGGSALLPLPAVGVPLAEKIAITRALSASGVNIEALNTVRKSLSRIKGGGLARAWKGGTLYCLIISDVLGDPLELIASGPTVGSPPAPDEALRIVTEHIPAVETVAPHALHFLQHAASQTASTPAKIGANVHNLLLANNFTAVAAAGEEARRRGYATTCESASHSEGDAAALGVCLAERLRRLSQKAKQPQCLVSGGEPVVTLPPPEVRGRGGRNQHLVLAALADMLHRRSGLEGVCLLSGGTDGEDGPTDAAGAIADALSASRARQLRLPLESYLRRCDAYHFFAQTEGLLVSGPTHTNVCDLRIALADR